MAFAFLFAAGGQLLLWLDILHVEAFHTLQNLAWIFLLLSGALLLRAYYLSKSSTSRMQQTIPVLAMVLSIGVIFLGPAFGMTSNYTPIYNPAQYEAKDVSIADDSWIVAVQLNDEAVAYPVEALRNNWLIYDRLGGEPFAVAFCPSCNCPLAYKAVINDSEIRFIMIGLYEQDPLLEDSGTNSWWNTGTGVAIAGPLKGQKLEQIPASISEWGLWKEVAPHTRLALVSTE